MSQKKRRILYGSTHVQYLEQSNAKRQKVEWWSPGAEEKAGMGSWTSMATDFQFYKTKVVLEGDGGDGCTTRSKFLISLNCTLQNSYNRNFSGIDMLLLFSL